MVHVVTASVFQENAFVLEGSLVSLVELRVLYGWPNRAQRLCLRYLIVDRRVAQMSF